ncbi:MAG: ChbG/HpnK family deacetylase [Candidatus Electrothrix sp. AR3]|nr:ChbG/HpnK family deacetylase [Candidatus Electrothrix sp. AR3]
MKLIINADDFGLTDGVNQSIIDCFLAGSLSSTTLMVNTAATAGAVRLARQHPELGVGLHFNLTLGVPLVAPTAIPSLLQRNGTFFGRQEWEKRSIMGCIHSIDIEREFKEQVRRFRTFGIPMTHIDSHQHVHVFPKVFRNVARYCVEHDIPLRIPWVWQERRRKRSLKRYVRSTLLTLLNRYNMAGSLNALRCNAGFASIFDQVVAPHEIILDNYKEILKNIRQEPFEFMVHPAWVDSELQELTAITELSKIERKIFTTHCLRKIAAEYGLELVSYGRI